MPAQARRQQEQEPAIRKAPSNLPFLGTAPPPFLLPLTLRRDSYLPVPFSFRLLGSQLRTCQVVARLLGARLCYHTADFLSSFRGGWCIGAVRFFLSSYQAEERALFLGGALSVHQHSRNPFATCPGAYPIDSFSNMPQGRACRRTRTDTTTGSTPMLPRPPVLCSIRASAALPLK